jgi:hypothetical protein
MVVFYGFLNVASGCNSKNWDIVSIAVMVSGCGVIDCNGGQHCDSGLATMLCEWKNSLSSVHYRTQCATTYNSDDGRLFHSQVAVILQHSTLQ